MSRNWFLVLLFAIFAVPAFAQLQMQPPPPKAPLAKFSLQLPLLKFTNSSVKTDKATGESVNDSVTEITTQALDDGFIGISMGKLALYIYPFFDDNHLVSAGYMLTDTIELGVDLGLNSGGNRESTQIGGWGYYYMNFSSFVLENGLSITLISRKDEIPPAAPIESAETSIKAASNLTYPLMRNLRYIGGVFIKNKSIAVDGGDKTSVFQFGIILAGLRMKWL